MIPPVSVTRELWELAKAGNREAFEKLFGLHTDRLLLFINAKLGSSLRARIEPQDLLQDAYTSALQSFDQFEYSDDGAFFRWMCRIITNRLRDSHDYFTAAKRQVHDVPKSAPTGPVTALARAENRERLQAALARLSEEHREIILLRYFEGLSAEEAGQRMNRSAGAIRSLLSRALVELGKHLNCSEESHS